MRRPRYSLAIETCLVFAVWLAGPGARTSRAQPPRSRPAASADTSTDRVLRALEDDWAHAVIRRDAAAIRRLTAPRWVYSDESGVMTRDEGIKSFTSGPDTVTEAGNDRVRVLAYGATAVVIGELWMRGHGSAGRFTHRYRYTDTWMRLGGRWQCIASQDYLLPEPRR